MSLEVVQLIYDQKKKIPANDLFYEQALQEIEKDGIAAQVCFLLKQQNKLEQTPAFFQHVLKEKYETGLYQNLYIKSQTNLLLNAFERKGIDVIPLKGVYFAETYFGDLGARATTDIDLLIKFKDLEKAVGVVKALGFTIDGEYIPGHFHCSFCKQLPHTPVPLVVEIHWNIVKEDTSNFEIRDLWKEAMPAGSSQYIKELCPDHTLYMICLHGWRHNLDSMKYFIDIIQVIYKHRSTIDFEKIFILARQHQTEKRLRRTLAIVYQQCPVLNTVIKWPYQSTKVPWAYRSQNKYKLYVEFMDYQFLSYDSWKHRLIEIQHWLWPSMHVAKVELGLEKSDFSFFKLYFILYKKRLSNIIKALVHG